MCKGYTTSVEATASFEAKDIVGCQDADNGDKRGPLQCSMEFVSDGQTLFIVPSARV